MPFIRSLHGLDQQPASTGVILMRSFDLNLLSSLINLTVTSISASSPADSGSSHFSAKHGCDLGALIRGELILMFCARSLDWTATAALQASISALTRVMPTVPLSRPLTVSTELRALETQPCRAATSDAITAITVTTPRNLHCVEREIDPPIRQVASCGLDRNEKQGHKRPAM